MSWTDKIALETINQLKEEFDIQTFIETGTFKGVNSFVQSQNFKYVLTCENNYEYYLEAKEKLKNKNISIFKQTSPKFLKEFIKAHKHNKSDEIVFIYLDAHFYNPSLKEKFIVKEELNSLKGFRNCLIAIHDFDNGMGHITYDGKTINLRMVKSRLLKINPKFHFYTNTPEFSDIHTLQTLKEIGLESDKEAQDNINYAWSKERLTKRGILYAIPKKLDLNKYKLIEIF